MAKDATLRQTRRRQGEVRIARQCLAIIRVRSIEPISGHQAQGLARLVFAFEEEVVGLWILGRGFREYLRFCRRKLRAQGVGDLLRYFALDAENVL